MSETRPQSIKRAQSALGIIAVLGVAHLVRLLAKGIAVPMVSWSGPAVAGLLIYGIGAKNRLAWQWGRVIAPLSAVLFALRVLATLAGSAVTPLIAVYISGYAVCAVCMVMVFQALGRDDSKRFFGLHCEKCDTFGMKAANLSFSRIVCRNCGHSPG